MPDHYEQAYAHATPMIRNSGDARFFSLLKHLSEDAQWLIRDRLADAYVAGMKKAEQQAEDHIRAALT